MALRCDDRGLLRMSWIALLDRNDQYQTTTARNVQPNAFNIRHAGLFHLVPDQSRTEIGAIPAELCRRSARRRAEDNGNIAVIEPFNFHPGLGPFSTGVISRPLPKGTFNSRIIEMNVAFDDDFRVCRNRQTGVLAFDHFERFSSDAANEFIFRHAIRHLDTAGQKSQRIVTERHSDLEWLAAGGIFFSLDAAVLAGRDVKSHGVLVMNHHPISAVVHPTFIRVARNIDTTGSDVPSTVLIVPQRSRKLKKIDISVFVDVLKKRALFDEFRRDGLNLLIIFFPDSDEIHLRFTGRKPQSEGQTFPRSQRVR